MAGRISVVHGAAATEVHLRRRVGTEFGTVGVDDS